MLQMRVVILNFIFNILTFSINIAHIYETGG
jgi:hypothetical protein